MFAIICVHVGVHALIIYPSYVTHLNSYLQSKQSFWSLSQRKVNIHAHNRWWYYLNLYLDCLYLSARVYRALHLSIYCWLCW